MTPATASERSAHQWVATLKTPMSTKKTSRGTSPTRAVSATEPPTAVVEGVKEAGAIMGIAVARSAVMSFSGLGGGRRCRPGGRPHHGTPGCYLTSWSAQSKVRVTAFFHSR